MKNKRASHVGMIISFVIFVTFIVFLYGVMKPTINTGQDKKDLIGYIETQIIKNTSSNLTTTSVKIKENKYTDNTCVILQNLLLFPEISIGPHKILVQDERDTLKYSYQVTSIFTALPHLKILRDVRTDLFFKIYSSPEFLAISQSSSIYGCTTKMYNPETNTGEYSIGSITIDKYIFEKNIVELKTAYDAYYEELKESLKIPPGNEFEFSFKPAVGLPVEATNGMTKPDEIYVEETPVQYVDSQANIKSGFITIKVW
jgi:hypothetical protein